MEDLIEKVEDLNISQDGDDINFQKYIKTNEIILYNIDNLIEKENKEDLICPIFFLF